MQPPRIIFLPAFSLQNIFRNRLSLEVIIARNNFVKEQTRISVFSPTCLKLRWMASGFIPAENGLSLRFRSIFYLFTATIGQRGSRT